MTDSELRTKLRKLLVERFDDEELRTLCSDLDVKYDILPGSGLEAKARELVDYMDRHERLADLMHVGRLSRPDVPWPETEAALPLQRPVSDWEGILEPDLFLNREDELRTLKQWLVSEQCRIVAILGIGGVGKSALAVKLRHATENDFDRVFGRSLLNAPSLEVIVDDCIKFFSGQQPFDSHEQIDAKIARLLKYIQDQRCLVVFDNFEGILQEGKCAGQYKEGYQEYGRLLKFFGTADHRSCLLITSREKPEEIADFEGLTLPVRSYLLGGLGDSASLELLRKKDVQGDERTLLTLIKRFGGNPMALKLVAGTVRMFGGDLAELLKEADELVIGAVADLWRSQFQRLSRVETEILYWLAIDREPLTIRELRQDLCSSLQAVPLEEALPSLWSRSMIEMIGSHFTLQPLIMEFVTKDLIERMFREIGREPLEVLRSHALMKAQAKSYVRETQAHLILKPVANAITDALGTGNVKDRLSEILTQLREEDPPSRCYGAGNVLHLALHLKINPASLDFSDLAIRQAYLQDCELHDVNFLRARLSDCTFTDIFGGIVSVAISKAGQYLAAGSEKGLVRLWKLPGKEVYSFKGHRDWVGSVTFSPSADILASGGSDRTICLWDLQAYRLRRTLPGHEERVRSLAFSPDGQTLASAGDDKRALLWDVGTGEVVKALTGHSDQVWSIAYSPDGSRIATGSHDKTICIWDSVSGDCVKRLHGHDGRVTAVVFYDNGILISGSHDMTLRIWDINSGECLKTLIGHTKPIWSVAADPNADLLASAGDDQTVRLWNRSNGELERVLYGHESRIWSIAIGTDGRVLASGSADQSIRTWDVDTGRCLEILKGYSNRIRSLSLSSDGKMLVAGSDDQRVRLWDPESGRIIDTLHEHSSSVTSVALGFSGRYMCSVGEDRQVIVWDIGRREPYRILEGQNTWVRAVALNPQEDLVAGGGEGQTVWIWRVRTGACVKVLKGHENWIRSVVFSPDGTLLSSAGDDKTIRIWEVDSGRCTHVLSGHGGWVRSLAYNPDGTKLASASDDETIHVWGSNGSLITILRGHTGRVRSVSYGLNGRYLVSGAEDQTVRLWDAIEGRELQCLGTHEGQVRSVVFAPDGDTVISAGDDETIRRWSLKAGKCIRILTVPKPYEGLRIAGITGVTEAQKDILRTLGATEA